MGSSNERNIWDAALLTFYWQKSSLIYCISHFVHFVAEAHRGHAETVTYSTVVHKIPSEQEELIHLQKQVKNGAISVDEALDRFKQWQNKKQRLPSTQQV